MVYYLAIDIGASSGRHILGWLENGVLKTEEIYRFKNGAENVGGRLRWNVDSLFNDILSGLKKAKEIDKIPSFIGIDTWAVDYALLDNNDELIGEVFCYRDGRGAQIKDATHKIIPFDGLYSQTGIQYQPFNTVYQLHSDKLSGKLSGAQSFLMLPDYFNFLLTGVKKQEYTNATSTGLVNAQTHKWDAYIISKLGFNDKLFGELSQPGTVVGEFTKEIQAKVGYNAKVILPATHDTASAVLAAPIEKGTPYISSGTWSLLGVEQTFAHTDGESLKLNYSNEGSIDYGFRYQKNIMGLWIIQQVKKELKEEYSFEQLVKLARQNVHSATVNVNDEKFLAPKSMLQAIWSDAGKMTAGQTAYCVFNSLAKCYKESLLELERLTGRQYSTLNIIGGGSKNALLNELTARETGLNIITGPTEATAIGNLIMQMIGSGDIHDLGQAKYIIKNSFDIEEVTF